MCAPVVDEGWLCPKSFLFVDTNMSSLGNGACQNKFIRPDHCGIVTWTLLQG